MTQTIHPKMLEKVARAIDPDAFKEMHPSLRAVAPKGKPREDVERDYEKNMIPRKKAACKKAEAAILAFCEGLPIEGAPRDFSKIDVILNTGRRIPDVVSDGTLYRGKLVGPYLPLNNEDNESVVSFIPLPTQETE